MSASPLQCACCDYFTLRGDGWEICPVCFWEDDGSTVCHPDKISGPNHMALREARENFIAFGSCERRLLPNVIGVGERQQFKLERRTLS